MDTNTRVEKLSRFVAKVMCDAKQESSRILKQIEATQTQLISRAEDDLLAKTYQQITDSIERFKLERGKRISAAMLENKQALLKRRVEFEQCILQSILEKLAAFCQTGEYYDYLQSQIKLAASAMGGARYTVYLCERDMHMAQKLGQALGLSIAQAGFVHGGAILKSENKTVDVTFDSKLDDLKAEITAKLSNI